MSRWRMRRPGAGRDDLYPENPVPLRFRIKYDDRNVTPNHSYAFAGPQHHAGR